MHYPSTNNNDKEPYKTLQENVANNTRQYGFT